MVLFAPAQSSPKTLDVALEVEALNNLADSFEYPNSLAELADAIQRRLDCTGTMVTKVCQDELLILTNAGLQLPPHYQNSMPLEYSICQHVAAMDFPLVIDDSNSHPLLKGNRAVSELSLAAYLGAPVHDADGKALGAICAFETRQRRWSEQEISYVLTAANLADLLLAESDT